MDRLDKGGLRNWVSGEDALRFSNFSDGGWFRRLWSDAAMG